MLNVSFHISWRFCPFSNFVPPIITTRSDFYSSLTWLMWKFHKYQLHTILTEYSTIWCQVCRFILLPSNFVSYIYLSSNFIRPKYWNIKVHIFWEGHKILQNLLQLFVLCTASKILVEILQNFVAFSEYMNFNKNTLVRGKKYLPCAICLQKPYLPRSAKGTPS